MENKKKYCILGGISAVLIIVAIVAVVVCNWPTKSEKIENKEQKIIQVNKSEQLAAPRKYEGLDVITAKLTETSTAVEFSVEIKNNTGKEIQGHTVQFTMIDENNNELGKISGFLSTIKPEETATIRCSGSVNMIMNAFDYKIEKMK